MTDENTKALADTALATGAITMPLWASALSGWFQLATSFFGLIFLLVRFWYYYREKKGS